MKTILLSLIILTLSACNSGNVKKDSPPKESEDLISMEEYCAKEQCRRNKKVSFLTDTGPIDQTLEIYWPVVQGNQLSLLPGDKVYIEAEIKDGLITSLNQVSEITTPEKTLVFDFQQIDGKVDMMLSVKNPFSSFIKFSLNMIDFRGQPHQTSSCPVAAGGGVYEMWPHAIPELMVSNIRVLSETDSMACEY